MSDMLKQAREVFDIEIAGLVAVRDRLDSSFERMADMCASCIAQGGKLILTGIGKSGYIGKKMAATLSSVGTPSIFMHPVEALHGDLGIMQKHDLMLALSYSGETDELLGMLTPAKRLGVQVIAITGYGSSSLAGISDLTVEMPVPKEACPFNLVPTTSTTALLALGDALAIVLLQRQGFTKENFGRLHPGGAIGRMVTMRVSDIMRGGSKFALVTENTKVREALLKMTEARCGAAIVADASGYLAGIFTDGDFRRRAEKDITVLDRVMSEVMTPGPASVKTSALAVEAIKLVEERHINSVVAVDDSGKVAGLIDVQDLPGLKLM